MFLYKNKDDRRDCNNYYDIFFLVLLGIIDEVLSICIRRESLFLIICNE